MAVLLYGCRYCAGGEVLARLALFTVTKVTEQQRQLRAPSDVGNGNEDKLMRELSVNHTNSHVAALGNTLDVTEHR